MYQFIPPVAYQQPFSERSPLWCRVSIPVPYTVVKLTTGAYVQELEHNPSRAGIEVVYEGGHVYVVSDAEGEALIAAGYSPVALEVDLGNGYADVTGTELGSALGYTDISA